MYRHLVTIEVGVVSGTYQRVELDRFTFDQHRLEGLDTQTVKGRRPVQQHGVLADNFSENINLVKQVVGTAGLKEYTDLSVQQVKDFMGQAKITGQDSFVRHNTRFYQVNFEAEQQGYRLVFEQHYAISKGVAYILTFSSEVDSYEMMKPMAARIMNSFSLK